MEKINLTSKEIEAIRQIRNSLVHRGCMPSIRELMSALGYKSPRSAQDIIESLIEKDILKKSSAGLLSLIQDPISTETHAQTVDVPLVGLVSCGIPIFAEENVETTIPISTNIAKPPSKYFILRATGDSMDLAGINDGDLVLIKQQADANNGDSVVALIDDEATIKEFHKENGFVVLRPRSSNPDNKPIVLTTDFKIQGIVSTVIPNL